MSKICFALPHSRLLSAWLLFLFFSCFGGRSELNFQYNLLDNSYYLYERDVGDIDVDGDNDIVGVQEGDTTLQVFRAPNWARSTLITITGTYRYPRADDFKLGDINGDGKLDVVTRLGIGPTDDGVGIAVWYENLGGGNFTQRVMGNSLEYVKDIVVVDLDRDGRLDVAMRMDDRTQVWLQESNGSWTEVLLAHSTHEGMEAGDLDMDGDPDLILNGYWFPTPNTPAAARVAGNYIGRSIDAQWYNQGGDWTADSCKVVVGDFDGDGTNDVAFSHSERAGYAVTWYRSSTPNGAGPWLAQAVTGVDYCHNLQAADFDLDGKVDLLVGGMTNSAQRGLKLMLNQGGGTSWTPFVIQSNGSYSAEIGDLDNDGDLDIVGIRHWSSAPSWFYRNNAGGEPSLDFWFYKQVSAAHARTFSLCFPDVDADEDLDIASGPYVYLNPGGSMTGNWAQVSLPSSVHAFATLDVDGDNLADLIAQQDNPGANRIDVYWVEASNPAGTAWSAPVLMGNVPRGTEPEGFQGYAVAQIVAGGRPEIIVNSPQGLYYFSVPGSNPGAGNWARTFVAANNSEEGIGVADLDGDGDLDISFSSGGVNEVKWARNPGDGSGNWSVFTIGTFPEADWPDRCAAADLNGDGRIDILVTEENTGVAANSLACWWEQPASGATNGNWVRRTITSTQYTLNSMDVGDVDQDGDVDLVLAEHRGTKRIAVWENDGFGVFTERRVDEGKESHLGARLVDLDGDRDLDLVSIAYDTFNQLHLWRNDSPNALAPAIDSVTALNAITVRVLFSKPVETVSAQTLANYSINNGVTISAAVLGVDTRTVTLTTSILAGGDYTLTVNHVTDLATPPNTIATNSQAAFTFIADTTPPTIASVTAVDATTVQVLFSEPVGTTAAQTAGNYSVNHGVSVSWAMLEADTRTVTLITTPLPDGSHTVTVNNVQDRAIPPNPMAPNTPGAFSYSSTVPTAGIAFGSAASAVDLDGNSSASLVFGQGALTNGYVVVGVSMYDTVASASITGATYDGSPMNFLGTAESVNAYSEMYLFGLAVGNKAGGNYTVAVTGSTGIDQLAFGVASFSHVNQTLSSGAFESAIGYSTGPTVTANSAAGDMVVDMLSHGLGGSSLGANQTQTWKQEDGTDHVDGVSSREAAMGTTTTMSHNLTTADAWSLGAVALKGSGQAAADTTPPSLRLVVASNANTVRVLFSEPVSTVSAQTLANYSINKGATILEALLEADTRTVRLTTSAPLGGNYTLTVNNVTDQTTPPNPIVTNSQSTFSYFADQIPPTIMSVRALNASRVQVRFSEPVDAVSAQDPANYDIGGGVVIITAEVGADHPRAVTLATSPMAGGNYALTINNVTDQATPPNPIAPNSQMAFSLLVQPPSILGIQNNGNDTITVRFGGTPGAQYIVQANGDLGPPEIWETVSTNTAGMDGRWTFTDGLSGRTQRYYRAAKP